VAQYLLLIYGDEQALDAAGDETASATLAGHVAFGEANRAAIQGGNALEPTGSATSVRRRGDGDFVITDGPFAETKEALGGYYLVEAADLDEALALAKEVPSPFGSIEVRPIRTFD
jgi:hypothetical protein